MKFVKGKIVFGSPGERKWFLNAWDLALQRTKEKTGLSHEQEIGCGMLRVSLIGYRKCDKNEIR